MAPIRFAVLSIVLLHAAAAQARPAAAPSPSALFGEREPQAGDEAVQSGAVAPSDEGAYDARRRAAFAAAEAFQGPLDGGWTLSAENEGAILDFRFVDRKDRLEGVWRDRRRRGPAASGLVESIGLRGDRLTLRFAAAPGAPDVLTLTRAAGGGWTGELSEAGRTRAVWLSKTSP